MFAVIFHIIKMMLNTRAEIQTLYGLDLILILQY